MAISAASTFEVRTTGSDSNGAFFVTGATGVDYSQQDVAQFSGTDLVVDASVNTKVTSASHSFTANDVGNGIQISSGVGFTAGFYQVVSVASGAATLDRSPAATSTSGGTWALGGALASIGIAFSAFVSGNTIYTKYNATSYLFGAGTVNTSGNRVSSAANSVSNGALNALVSYDTNRTVGNTDANKSTFKINANSVGYLVTLTGSSWFVANIIFNGNRAVNTGGLGVSSSGSLFIRDCKFTGCGSGAAFSSANGLGLRLEFTDCAAGGGNPVAGVSGGTYFACDSHDNISTSAGFQLQSSAALLINCKSYNNPGPGFQSAVGNAGIYQFFNCDAYNNTGASSDGFRLGPSGANGASVCVNCVAVNNGRYGFNGVSASQSDTLINCASYNNTSGRSNNVASDIGAITLTADPFTNAAGGDFSLNNTVGGGRSLRGAGIPGVMPGGLSTGYLDIGALQHADAGGVKYNSGLQGGMAG